MCNVTRVRPPRRWWSKTISLFRWEVVHKGYKLRMFHLRYTVNVNRKTRTMFCSHIWGNYFNLKTTNKKIMTQLWCLVKISIFGCNWGCACKYLDTQLSKGWVWGFWFIIVPVHQNNLRIHFVYLQFSLQKSIIVK